MIGFLKGKIIESYPEQIVVDVAGVGYIVESGSESWLEGETVALHIYTHVREDEIKLFGFRDRNSIILFKKLLTINGIGPKSALKIIQTHGSSKFIQAILAKNPAGVKVTGIGEKTAQKVILDLQEFASKNLHLINSNEQISKPTSSEPGPSDEAVQVLINFGFSQREIDLALAQIPLEPSDTTTKYVKKLLDYLRK